MSMPPPGAAWPLHARLKTLQETSLDRAQNNSLQTKGIIRGISFLSNWISSYCSLNEAQGSLRMIKSIFVVTKSLLKMIGLGKKSDQLPDI